jgi:uncharacterized hydrophobic protein (TIGR00271 family)
MKASRLARSWHKFFATHPLRLRTLHEGVSASLVAGATFNSDYVAMLIASCVIATFGLLENSPAVIIGAMIIAPIMPVIQAAAYGALEGSALIFWRAAATMTLGVLASVALSALLARVVGLSVLGSEILSRTRPTLLDLGIALAAGAIGSFARVRSSIANTLAGTAIAVALMPPLCVAGIGVAGARWSITLGALLLFATNLLGITLASMFVLLLGGYARRRAGPALGWTVIITMLIVVPLAISFRTMVREAALENAFYEALTTRTETFRHATLVSSRFNWLSDPPEVTLLVRSGAMLSSHQVSLLEAFAQRATGQRFKLAIDVSEIQSVTAEGSGPLNGEQSNTLGP